MSPRIGTAAWSVPRAVADTFPPGDSLLARYAQVFDAVEINSSFYRPHRRSTYERWAATVPDGFRFAVKAPKAITHEKRLVGAQPEIERFLDEAGGLGQTLGPLLVQLPPSLAFDPQTAAPFFADLRARTPTPVVCEPRHASWFTADADALLREGGVARVAADPAPVPAAALCGGWPGLRYTRLHGAPRIYYSDYSSERLAEVAANLTEAPVESWCIFDNTALGFATANALDLRRLLSPG